MSVKIMSQVWELESVGATDKLVLLSLADHADDEGICYPSIRRLCERTGLKERATQNIIRRLVEAGFLSVQYNAGRRGANLYKIDTSPRTKCTPHEVHPARNAPLPPHFVTETPAPDAPEPLKKRQGTVKEDHFDEFWSGWPNKVGKDKAKKAWRSLSAKNKREAVQMRDAWFASWRRQNPQASPIHASSYLNGKRWEDEFTPANFEQSDDPIKRWKKISGAAQ